MDKNTRTELINNIIYSIKLFSNVIIFALLFALFAYLLSVDAVIGYKMIIFGGLIGAFRAVYILTKRILNQ